MEDDVTQHTLDTLIDAHSPQVTSMMSSKATSPSREDQSTSSMLTSKLDTTIDSIPQYTIYDVTITSDNQVIEALDRVDTPHSIDKEVKKDLTPDSNKNGASDGDGEDQTEKEGLIVIGEKQNSTIENQQGSTPSENQQELTLSTENQQDFAPSIEEKEISEDQNKRSTSSKSKRASKGEKRGSNSKERKQGSASKEKKVGSTSKMKEQGSNSKDKKEGSTPKVKKPRSTAKQKKEGTVSKTKKETPASKQMKQDLASKEKKHNSPSKGKKQNLDSKEKKPKSTKDTARQQRKRPRADLDTTDPEVGVKKKQKTEQSQTDSVSQAEVIIPRQAGQEEKSIATGSASDDKGETSHEGNSQGTLQVDGSMLEESSSTTAVDVKENASSGDEEASDWEDHKVTPGRYRVNKSAVNCPLCGKKFTSLSRLYQFHYSEGSQTCPGPKRKQVPKPRMKGNYPCPSCGKVFTSSRRLNQFHYNKTTQTCIVSHPPPPVVTGFSNSVNAVLVDVEASEQELYAAIPKDASASERNAVWRRILKQYKALRCQNDECDYKAINIGAMSYHSERCGKEVILACPECNKTYTTKAGLDYHYKREHSVSADVSTDTVDTKPTLQLEVPLKRKAAIKASKNLAKIHKPLLDEVPVKSEVTTPVDGAPVEELSDEAYAEAVNKLNKGSVVKCPFENCDLTFKSASGLRYHVKRCTGQQKFKCKVCHKTISTLGRFQNHMAKKHRIGEQASEDKDYAIPKAVTVQSSDEEDHVSKKKSTSKSNMYSYSNLSYVYQTELKSILAEMLSTEMLFTDWQPSLVAWERCEPKECGHYAPQSTCSMKYRFVDNDDVSSPVSQLPLFHAALGVNTPGATFNVGGPVWSMGWAPIGGDSSTQHVAMAVYQTLDETYPLDVPLQHRGAIQLWSMLLGDQPSLPQLSLVICHQYGCVRGMKWCPSGCASKPTISCDSQRLARLGLLALACSDGLVRILSVPYPELLLEKLGPIKGESSTVPKFDLFVTPKSICCLLSPGNLCVQSDCSSVYGQCHDVEWLPRQPHNKIAASFSNGSVVIWDVLTSSWLLRGLRDYCDNVMYPQLQIKAHAAICRSISWCPDDTDYLFTVGYDVRMCLWDLKYPHEPVEKWEKVGQGLRLQCTWPLLNPGVLFLEDTLGVHGASSVCYLDLQTSNEVAISKRLPHQMTFSYCHWKSRVAFGTITGDLVLRGLPSFINFFKPVNPSKRSTKSCPEYQRYNYCLYCFTATPCDTDDDITSNHDDITMEQLSHHKCLVFQNYPEESKHQTEYEPDLIPLSAVTKVAWNPCQQHCDWLLAATNAGLVRLVNVKSAQIN